MEADIEGKMRRDSIFWGMALILAGTLLFLQAEGLIQNVLQYFWPLALILVGGWIILLFIVLASHVIADAQRQFRAHHASHPDH